MDQKIMTKDVRNVLINKQSNKKCELGTTFQILVVQKAIYKTPAYTLKLKFPLCNFTNNNLPYTTKYHTHCLTRQN